MSLSELLISLAILSIVCMGISISTLNPIQDKFNAITCLQICTLNRMKAIAYGQDISLATNHFSSEIPKTTLSLNVPALGFKSTGRTKTAGTLTVGTHKITLSVGFGRPQLKDN